MVGDLTIDRRRLVIGTGAALAMPALLLRAARAADAPIRIGFPTPLTGPFGAEAKDQVRCANLAIKQFNAAGGLKGRQVELLVRDDKLNPGEAATRTLELIEKDKVDCIVGSLSSSVQLAVNEVTKARGVLYVSISQSDAITAVPDFAPSTFHEALNPHMTTGAVARYALKPGMKVAILYADYAYGQEMAAGFKRAIAAMQGVEIVLEMKHPFGVADYSTFLPRLRSAKADVVCICNFGRDQANAIKQAADFGLKRKAKIVVPVLLYNQRLAGSPEAFEGVVVVPITSGSSRIPCPKPKPSTSCIAPTTGAPCRPTMAPTATAASVSCSTPCAASAAPVRRRSLMRSKARRTTPTRVRRRCAPATTRRRSRSSF